MWNIKVSFFLNKFIGTAAFLQSRTQNKNNNDNNNTTTTTTSENGESANKEKRKREEEEEEKFKNLVASMPVVPRDQKKIVLEAGCGVGNTIFPLVKYLLYFYYIVFIFSFIFVIFLFLFLFSYLVYFYLFYFLLLLLRYFILFRWFFKILYYCRLNPDKYFYAFDFSPSAIEIFKRNPEYTEENVTAFVSKNK